ncbi:MAG TPA: autotransporter outer membrane beta-barrel domain-containing protein [Pseudolabrys sp.]|nr:autotransporter outer membrane beta-barrel domain-containing protein [Pseudolabrys sp.]
MLSRHGAARHWFALLFVIGLLSCGPDAPAWATCNQSGSSVSCTDTTTNYDAGSQSGITITVQPGAIVNGFGPNKAIRLTNPSGVIGDALINNGSIDGLIAITSAGGGIDSFTNNGVLKITDPNTALDTHSMSGADFIQSASGSFLARVDSNGFNDSILTFSAMLGGRFVAVIQPGLYTTPINYFGVITTFSGISGAFDSVSASSPFLSATLTPSGNDLNLTITRIPFNAVPGATPNQQSVGNILEAAYATTPTGDAATLFTNLFAATSLSALDQLSGAGTAAAQDAGFAAGSMFGDAMSQQGLAWLSSTPTGNSVTVGGTTGYAEAPRNKFASKQGYDAFAAMHPQNPSPEGRWRAWGLGFGGARATDGQSAAGTADQTSNVFGGAFGADHQVAADLLFGFAVGGSRSHFSVDSLSTSGHADAAHLGVYAVHAFGPAYLAATLNYARADNVTERTITGIGPTETAKGRFASDQLGGRLEIGQKQTMRGYSVTPFAAIEPTALWQHAYTESSTTAGGAPGVLGLSYQSNRVTSFPAFLGAQFDKRYRLSSGQTLSSYLRAAWVHEFRPERSIQATFIAIPSAGFTADGARAASDAIRITTGGTLALNETTALFANLNSELSSRSRSLAGMAGARMNW